MQERMERRWEMNILKWIGQKCSKTQQKKWRILLMGISLDWTQTRKESVTWRQVKRKLSEWNTKIKTIKQLTEQSKTATTNRTEHPQTVTTSKCVKYKYLEY